MDKVQERAARIEYLRELQAQQDKLAAELAELPILEAAQAQDDLIKKAEKARAVALSELAAGLAAVSEQKEALDAAFVALVDALCDYVAKFDGREKTVSMLAKRCKHGARLSANRHFTKEEREDPKLHGEIDQAIGREAFSLWVDAGGLNDSLEPFPTSAFEGNDHKTAAARALVELVLHGNELACYDPARAGSYLKYTT